MKNLATLAFNRTHKVTKTRAMEIIEHMAPNATADTMAELAELYSYFKPSIPTKPKTSSDWVRKAVAKNDVRYYLNRLNVEAGKLMATDGSRLHICSTDLPDGAYDDQLNPIAEEHAGKFPDVQRVIIRHDRRVSLSDVEIVQHVVDTKHRKGTTVDVKLDDVIMRFDLKFWSDAVNGFTGNAQVHFKTPSNSVYIEQDDRQAIVMPVRI